MSTADDLVACWRSGQMSEAQFEAHLADPDFAAAVAVLGDVPPAGAVEFSLRQGVSEPVHRVLDVLDKSRAGWAQLSLDALAVEIELETAGLDRARAVAPSVRLVALLLFIIERAEGATA